MIINLFFLITAVAAWRLDTPRGDLIAIAAGVGYLLSFFCCLRREYAQ